MSVVWSSSRAGVRAKIAIVRQVTSRARSWGCYQRNSGVPAGLIFHYGVDISGKTVVFLEEVKMTAVSLCVCGRNMRFSLLTSSYTCAQCQRLEKAGLGWEEYQSVYERQEGKCLLCRKEAPLRGSGNQTPRLCIGENSWGKKVLLCRRCLMLVKIARQNPSLLTFALVLAGKPQEALQVYSESE